MSVAAPTTMETKGPAQPMNLAAASWLGGIYVLASLAVVFFAVPQLWTALVGAEASGPIRYFGHALQLLAIPVLGYFGYKLAGENPPKGLRGGVFLAFTSIVVGFFLIKYFLGTLERMTTGFEIGQVLSLLFFSFCLFLFWKFLKSDRMPRWSVALENAGWFDAHLYKRNQGVRVRRFTILGILIVLGSGIYTMWRNKVISSENWIVSMPFSGASLMLLPDIHATIPLILIALTIWFAWRIVNLPVFADFLIATEAEINKVSWTPRPKLIRDTIVVLITVLIITLFLFVVDMFWGILLSRSWVGILPSQEELSRDRTQQVNPNEW
jgi:preprotein translocase SecE subunit